MNLNVLRLLASLAKQLTIYTARDFEAERGGLRPMHRRRLGRSRWQYVRALVQKDGATTMESSRVSAQIVWVTRASSVNNALTELA